MKNGVCNMRRLDTEIPVIRREVPDLQILNRTASALFSLNIAQHAISIGLQNVSGDTGWMRIGGTGGIYLANNIFNHAFDNLRERSWLVRYDLNFVGYGIPECEKHLT